MRRKTFDALLTTGGLVLAAILLVAGALLTWGYKFADNNVHTQLAAQRIYFPAKGSQALAPKEIGPYLEKYAGQQLTNGAQAKAYADHFIAVHLKGIGGGLTYSQLSAKAQAQPKNTALQNEVNTVFKGETLRGLLLNAYAFWKVGQIALIAAIASFAAAGVMLVLSVLGFLHLRRVNPSAELLARMSGQNPATTTA